MVCMCKKIENLQLKLKEEGEELEGIENKTLKKTYSI